MTSHLAWALAILTLLMIPVQIRGDFGFVPGDDAHRHVGKAISGKPWQDILVMRDDITIDHNAGWHFVLTAAHKYLGWDRDALMSFSTVGLFILVSLSALLRVRRPEALVVALLVLNLTHSDFIHRLMLGRPYLVTEAILITLLFSWRPSPARGRSPALLAVTVVLFALATWIHGSWYLLAVLPVSYLLAGQTRDSVLLTVAWIVGSVVGAVLSGYGIEFLIQHIQIGLNALGKQDLVRFLVTEFWPSDGAFQVVIVLALVVVWRVLVSRERLSLTREPAFMLVVLGWLLGLKVRRFWIDWGLPAAIVWLTLEFQILFAAAARISSFRRLAFTSFACCALFFLTTSDIGGRWSNHLFVSYLNPDMPGITGWLPDDGGIVYSASMDDFYCTFFENPKANWKYVLGFEQGLMIEENFETLRNIQWNNYSADAYAPWVEKMGLADRLIFWGPRDQEPSIPELEWHHTFRGRWIGRVRRPSPITGTP